MKSIPQTPILTLSDLADTGLSLRQLRHLCAQGVLPAQKIGRDWIITLDRKAIDAILESRPQRGKYNRSAINHSNDHSK